MVFYLKKLKLTAAISIYNADEIDMKKSLSNVERLLNILKLNNQILK